MTKTQILAALAVAYPMGVVPPVGNPELIETVGDVKKYLYHHLVSGKDQNGDPVAHKEFKVFYVWKEGNGSEAAYYEDTTATNSVDKNVVAVNASAPTAKEIYAVYMSTRVRECVRGMMVRAANDIYNESGGVANHSQRMKWVIGTMSNLEANLNIMMTFISVNAVVLGGTWADSDIQYLVNTNIDKWAITIYT